jgi:L-ribulokinase
LLTGLLIGQTLHTTAAEVYRALVEATAFGALTIIRRLESNTASPVREVINCGGIAEKSQLRHAGLRRRVRTATDEGQPTRAQTCALGAAMAGAVAARRKGGGHDTFAEAQAAMGGVRRKSYKPDKRRHAVYLELQSLYRKLHDAFGTREWTGNLYDVMKGLLALKDRQRGGPKCSKS